MVLGMDGFNEVGGMIGEGGEVRDVVEPKLFMMYYQLCFN